MIADGVKGAQLAEFYLFSGGFVQEKLQQAVIGR